MTLGLTYVLSSQKLWQLLLSVSFSSTCSTLSLSLTQIITSIFLYNLVIPRCMHTDLIVYCVARYISSCLSVKFILSHLICSQWSHAPFQTCSASIILLYLNSKIGIHTYAWNIFLLISMFLDLSCHCPLCVSETSLIKTNLKQLPCCSNLASCVNDLQNISIFGYYPFVYSCIVYPLPIRK